MDVNVPNMLDGYEIENFSLNEGSIIVVNDYTFKDLYNDLDNPCVLKKKYDG